MNDRVRILKEDLLSDNWAKLKRFTFEVRKEDGQWERQEREIYDRGNAAVLLLCNPEASTVILTRQFRLPVHLQGEDPWLIEACAGLLDGDEPEACARREAEEETGYRPTNVRHLFDAYMSPGSVTEKLSFFLGDYDESAKVSGGGGLAHEGEDIEVIELPFATAMAMIGTGEISDAKTIMLLQHVALSGAMGP